MLAIVDLQTCVYKYLKELGLSVKDVVPAKTQLPYVQFGGFEATSNHTKTSNRQDYTLTLHVWCIDYSGRKFYEMLEQVASLEEAELEIGDNYSIDKVSLEFMNTVKEEYKNEVISHGIIQMRFSISQL